MAKAKKVEEIDTLKLVKGLILQYTKLKSKAEKKGDVLTASKFEGSIAALKVLKNRLEKEEK